MGLYLLSLLLKREEILKVNLSNASLLFIDQTRIDFPLEVMKKMSNKNSTVIREGRRTAEQNREKGNLYCHDGKTFRIFIQIAANLYADEHIAMHTFHAFSPPPFKIRILLALGRLSGVSSSNQR